MAISKQNIEIKNYFSIKKAKLNNFNSNEIYLLGENGVGKTILLQAIFIAFSQNSNVVVNSVLYENSKYKQEVENNKPTEFNTTKKTVYAYGVHRNKIVNSESKPKEEYSTLFIGDAELLDPIAWLKQLDYQELEADKKGLRNFESIKLEIAKDLLTNLLDEEISIEVSSQNVIFTEKGTNPLEFHQLSDGYKSVLIWVSDLIQRMSKEQSNITKLQDFRGVVLIDELDMFLHPKWAYKIMEKLRNWFPKVQFIISTHSPVLILGASKEAIFYKVYKENGETKVSEPVSGISNLMANSIMTSPLFDLPQAYSRAFDKEKETLRLGDDFIYDKIHDFVSNEIKKKNNVEEKDIMDLIREKYNEI